MRIYYHGTNKENAEKILKSGFLSGTWFALSLQDALGFGGAYVFEVALKKFDSGWQFHVDKTISPEQIVRLTHYTECVSYENEELRKKVFESNTREPQYQGES